MAKTKTQISDKDFWRILRANGGLFARTARAIEKEFGFHYSRQTAHERANKQPELLADIEEENSDLAEEILFQLLRSKNEKIQADIAKFYLKTKGKNRGYGETIEQTIVGSGAVLFLPENGRDKLPTAN